MKKIKLVLILTIATLSFSSCNKSAEESLSGAEIIEGLKEALKVGTDTASSKLSITNGYFKDQAVKLLLPEEITNSLNTFKSKSINVLGLGEITGADIYTKGIDLPGSNYDINALSSKEEDLILGINRAAESAAKDAGPIFWEAITDITIEDGSNILFGGVDNAATTYLDGKTRTNLFSKFEPKIDNALKSIKVGDKSVVTTYENYIGDYNAILNQIVPTSITSTATIKSLMNMNTVQADDLSAYSTDKGLTGLFLKVADEEKNIRKNPFHRVTEILSKVFGELDK